MVYSTIRFKEGEVLNNVLSCDEAPTKPGFIAVWIDDKIFYFSESSIRGSANISDKTHAKELNG